MTDTPNNSSGGGGRGCLIAILVILFAFVLAVGSGAYYLYYNYKSLGVAVFRHLVESELISSGIEKFEMENILAQYDRLGQAIIDDRISSEQISKLIEEMKPTLAFGLGLVIIETNLKTSGLSPEEVTVGTLQIRRLARGYYDGVVTDQDLKTLGDSLGMADNYSSSDGQIQLSSNKSNLSDEELHVLIARARELADQAKVADVVENPDFGSEIKAALDKLSL